MIRIVAAKDVADVLQGALKDALEDANGRTGGAIRIEADPKMASGRFEIREG